MLNLSSALSTFEKSGLSAIRFVNEPPPISNRNLSPFPSSTNIDKVFASHLHTDHVGDFPLLLVGGWLSGRYTPLHIYGGSGSTPELGTKAFADAQVKAWAWDIQGRSGALPDAGGKVEVHEFDYKGKNHVVYDQNGVVIRAWPAIHVLDGAVSL